MDDKARLNQLMQELDDAQDAARAHIREVALVWWGETPPPDHVEPVITKWLERWHELREVRDEAERAVEARIRERSR